MGRKSNKEIKGSIYFVLNKINGKYYIGKTIQPVKIRWGDGHLSYARREESACSYFHKAIRKYGESSFEVRTIFTCFDENTLNEAEQYFIKFFESTNKYIGYNTTEGGLGGCITDTARLNMSLAHMGKSNGPHSESTKRKIGEANKISLLGKKASEETRKKMSKSQKGRIMSEQTKLKILKTRKEKGLSEKQKKTVQLLIEFNRLRQGKSKEEGERLIKEYASNNLGIC